MEPRRYLDIYIAALWLAAWWKIYLFSRQLELLRTNPEVPEILVNRIANDAYQSKRDTMIKQMRIGVVTSWMGLVFKTVFDSFLSALIFEAIGLKRASLPATWMYTAAYSSDSGVRVFYYCAFEVFSHKAPVVALQLLGFLFNIFAGTRDRDIAALSHLIFTIIYVFLLCAFAIISASSLIYLTDTFGVDIFFYLLIPVTALTFVATIAFVHLLAPSVYHPLPEGDARDQVNNVAQLARFSQSRILCLPSDSAIASDGHPNAYYMGTLGANLILVSQGLLDTMRPDEVSAVVAHEIGHWHFYHTSISYILSVAETIVFSTAMKWSYGNTWLLEAFGFDVVDDNPHPVIGMYIMASQVYFLGRTIWRGLTNNINLFCEYFADDYACSLGQGSGLRNALLGIAQRSRGFPLYDGLFAAWFFGHPTLLGRIDRIDQSESRRQ